MCRRIIIDLEVDRPFENAEQERYVLATIEDALETEIWFDVLANAASAPQEFRNVKARFARPATPSISNTGEKE